MQTIINVVIIAELLIFAIWLIFSLVESIIGNMRYFGNFRQYMWCKKEIDKVIERKYEEHRRGEDVE